MHITKIHSEDSKLILSLPIASSRVLLVSMVLSVLATLKFEVRAAVYLYEWR